MIEATIKSHPASKEEATCDGDGSVRPLEQERGDREFGSDLREEKMGSTDSASSAHSGGSSCGLVSSLLPNSCRGRAESFARRLHRRLTSLGGEGGSSGDNEDGRSLVNRGSTETSRLQAPSNSGTSLSATTSSSASLQGEERVLERQPQHSAESDIYYDFHHLDQDHDQESASTISPAEMANAAELAKILVNPSILKSNHHETCHCSPGPRPPDSGSQEDQETGFVFSSPLAGLSPETESSEAYFDPESSETDKSRAETFFDPQGTSESEAAETISNGPVYKISQISGRRRSDRVVVVGQDGESSKKHSDESSDESSSSSSRNAGTLEGARPSAMPIGCSSEESINGRSSLESTSPSHESLWSTFDDSTMSLQDENGPGTVCNSVIVPPIKLAKSHSDSEIIGKSGAPDKGVDETDFVMKQRPRERETSGLTNGEMHEPAGLPAIGRLRLEEPVEPTIGIRVSTFDDRIGDTCGNDDISKLVERIARCPNIHGTVESLADEEDGKEDVVSGELEGQAAGSNGKKEEAGEDEEEDEEEEEEEDRPQRVRRCSSLKTGKTPPGTPGRKKIVRFADVLGLDLADVRTFLDEIPKVPNSAYSDLIYDEAFQKDSSPVNFWGTGPATFTTPLFAATMGPKGGGAKLDRILVPLFQQPGGLPNFLDLVRERQVCLENVIVQDPLTICLQGTVRVRNLDFHKSVHVRYTLDSWRNFSDLQATYAANSCDGFSDKFTFALYCHTLKVGQRLELAVRFQCKGTQYWDNNAGINYCFQCLPATPANPGTFIPITTPANSRTSPHEWSPNFY